MLIGKISGGLGNQMFQYAFYKYLQSQKLCKLALDISEYEVLEQHNGFELPNVFGVMEDEADPCHSNKLKTKLPLLFRLQGKIFGHALFGYQSHFKENYFNIDQRVFENSKTDLYLEGYYQTDKYIEKLLKLGVVPFKFKEVLNNDEMAIKRSSSVSIHIRGGDYLSSWRNRIMFNGICDEKYYLKAIKRIYEVCDNPVFYVFSNDRNYALSILPDLKFKFVDWNYGSASYRDMYLMSICKHNIIANSSFSWWAAYLNENKNKTVIAPKKWLNSIRYNQNNIVPNSWERV